MFNAKTTFATVMIVLLLASPVKADLILTATYTNWTQTGPLSFGLAAMPDEFSVAFNLEPHPTPPGVPIPFPNTDGPIVCSPPLLCSWNAANVRSSSVTFGDATWTTLASFDFEIDDGELYLDYAFEPLAFTQTSLGGIVLNGPLQITGTDIASGEAFSYGYSTRTLSLVQVSEPFTLTLLCIGLAGMGMTRRRMTK